ncbi:MAG: protoporphyrinogen oxidase, partial [Armatimonadetes bacterium]|nr:protoporphyrinogen oxidase [Armatimonadota bacterium]
RLAELLEGVPYAASATMSLAYREQDCAHPLDGFGFVVPRQERLTILGCTFTHRKYPHRAPPGIALFRAFLGEAALGLDDAELERRVLSDLRALLGLQGDPLWTRTTRHERSMAQYPVGHLAHVEEMESRTAGLPGLALCGNAFRGIGIPDCVRSGEEAAAAVWKE